MTPSIWLRESRARFFDTTIDSPTLADCLRGNVEYTIYCRALFHLKAGLRCSPDSAIFTFCRKNYPMPVEIIIGGFARAIAAAEAQERA